MRFSIVVISFMIMSSCGNSLNKQDLIYWLNDKENGYYSEFKGNEFVISALRVPSKLKALNELQSFTSTSRFDSISKTYDHMQYFQLILKSTRGSNFLDDISIDQIDYFHKQSYLENDLRNEISLVCGDDTLSPCIFLPERTFGLRPETIINLGFLVEYSPNAEIFIHSEELKLKGIRLSFLSKEMPNLILN